MPKRPTLYSEVCDDSCLFSVRPGFLVCEDLDTCEHICSKFGNYSSFNVFCMSWICVLDICATFHMCAQIRPTLYTLKIATIPARLCTPWMSAIGGCEI